MATGRVPTTANSPLTTKGDLFGYSTAPARLAVGSDGETIVADNSTATGLRYQGSQVAAKNAIINGGMDIWQRGTSFGAGQYTADRWYQSGGTGTSAQETTIVPSGFRYAMKFTASGTTIPNFLSALETNDSLRFAGQTVCLSAYFASSTTRAVSLSLQYSTSVDNPMLSAFTTITPTSGGTGTATSTYSRVSGVWSVPSDAKTIRVIANTGANMATSEIFYVTGIQLELGSVPTAFLRTGGTIQGELAACQRYYWRQTAAGQIGLGVGPTTASTTAWIQIQNPVAMRVAPTSVDYATVTVSDGYSYTVDVTSVNGIQFDTISGRVTFNTASGLTQGRTAIGQTKSSGGYIGFSAEL